ncbi:MAG: TraB/GumN family protein [Methyloversatilis sp.]|jgi:uncharacterized protein YbaP (TraB family)|nr:TraB/GumN family protein [Methyloversatilis sp.]MBP6195260.1 TraB/GumN family protein [Methyloversatilis sp.]MBP9118170.1 TraB/GumN family protein [Methyloversatilis sp.]
MISRRLFLQRMAASGALLAAPSRLLARAPDPFGKGLLWQITHRDTGDGPVSHLFGTLHSGDPRVLERAGALRELIAGARLFMPELVADADAVNTFIAASTSDGGDLPRLVGRKHWPRVSQMLGEHGVDERVQPRLRPWAALVTLLQPVGAAQPTLDEVLIGAARASERPIRAIETVQEQIDAIATLPAATQIALLIDSARRHDAIQAGITPMIEAWLAGDTAALADINAGLMEADPSMRRHSRIFMRSLLTRRNERFVQRLLPEIREGGLFAAFGASHLVGPQGVLAGLQAAGCIVKEGG